MVTSENVPVLRAEGLGAKGYDGSNSPSDDSENNVSTWGEREAEREGSIRDGHPSLQLLECLKCFIIKIGGKKNVYGCSKWPPVCHLSFSLIIPLPNGETEAQGEGRNLFFFFATNLPS